LPESRHRRRRNRAGPGRGRSTAPVTAPRSRRRKTNWLYLVASALIALLVIGSFAITGTIGLLGGGRQSGTSDQYVEGIGIQHEIMPTRDHVSEGQSVEYNSVPPTSGNHWPRWSNCGFFEEEIPDERVVHNLEHSNIVVSYNLTSPEEVDQLRDVMNDIGLANTLGVTRFYSEILPGTVTLSAWGVSDTMAGIDKDRIVKFFETYAGNLGPEGNITCLNTGTMP
jgi:hypothetical protein